MTFSCRRIPGVVLLCLLGSLVRAESISEKRIEALFRPPLAEQMALSTDGRYLAYTQHSGSELAIIVMDLDRMERKTRILVEDDRPVLYSKERRRPDLRFLQWANGRRLVFAPSIEVVHSAARAPDRSLFSAETSMNVPFIAPRTPVIIAPIMAIDADGGNPRELVNAKTFQVDGPNSDYPAAGTAQLLMRPPQIKGFGVGEHKEGLLIEVRGVSHMIPNEMYRLNPTTGALTSLHQEHGKGHFVYDWNGRPRLSVQTGVDRETTYFYRAAHSSRWEKMPTPEGSTVTFNVSPATYFSSRAIPLGFDYSSNVLIYAANTGRDTFGIYGLNVQTRRGTELAIENPHLDLAALNSAAPSPALVFDRHRATFAGVRARGSRPFTAWLDPELAEIQRAAEVKFPRRSVQIMEWNETRTRCILRVTGATEAGRFYLFQRPEELLTELMRAMPWLPSAELHDSKYFQFPAADGRMLSGFLTLPKTPRLNPPPLIVWFAPGFPPRPHPEFDPQAQVFADMGFAVCRLNNRGVIGLGAKYRDALRRDFDHVPAEDALAAVEWVAGHHRIDRKRVVTFGEGFAGHLALRATQLHPEAFRCVVLSEPIVNLASWVQPPPDSNRRPSFAEEMGRAYLEGGGAKLGQLASTSHADQFSVPVFIMTRADQPRAEDATLAAGISLLRSQLKRRDIPSVSVAIGEDFNLGLPRARTRVYREMSDFFDQMLYNFDVKVGPTRVVK